MPPWQSELGYGDPFVGDRRLSDTQIELIARWVDADTLQPFRGLRRTGATRSSAGMLSKLGILKS